MLEDEEEFKDICVNLILDFCRSIIEDQIEIDDVTISQVNAFSQEWIDENFGKDQTIIEEPEYPSFNDQIKKFDPSYDPNYEPCLSQNEHDPSME